MKGTFKRLTRPMIGWKLAYCVNEVAPSYSTGRAKREWRRRRRVIVKLRIPTGAVIFYGGLSNFGGLRTNKRRASRAEVLALFWQDVTKQAEQGSPTFANGTYTHAFIYRVGEVVRPQKQFSRAHKICVSGIHFFCRRCDAECYL